MPKTVRKLAELAGVSPATISRYYSGNDVVSTETARKIEKAAKELGYTHKTKTNKDKGVIAVLIPNLQLGFYNEVLKELIEQIPNYNYRMVFIPIIPANDQYKIYFKEMSIVGVIYLDEYIDRDILNYITSKRIKTVMCGGVSFDSRSEMVHINDMSAAYEGTKYLIEQGHERILLYSDQIQNISTCFQRITGCKRAFDEAGISFDDKELIGYGPLTFENGYRLTKQFIENKTEFTAIFAFSDETAVGAISALHDYGVKVPEDVSILGFDDIALAKRVTPRLTTIHQPIKKIVTKTLDEFLELDEINSNVEITLPYEIKVRDTVKRREK